jgi:hypothetical protein
MTRRDLLSLALSPLLRLGRLKPPQWVPIQQWVTTAGGVASYDTIHDALHQAKAARVSLLYFCAIDGYGYSWEYFSGRLRDSCGAPTPIRACWENSPEGRSIKTQIPEHWERCYLPKGHAGIHRLGPSEAAPEWW